ncbi:MAG: DUF4301 family protein [Syntrophothermus sp.]
MLKASDLLQIKSKGIDTKVIERQLENFRNGFPWIDLVKPATPGQGIFTFSGEERNFFLTLYDQHFRQNKILKFVPASGAASRMFKKLFEYLENENKDENENDQDSVNYFLKNLDHFAFYGDLKAALEKKGTPVETLMNSGQTKVIIRELLTGEMEYAHLPKALLKFHYYPDGARVAMEEHLVEAAHYATDADRVARIHFTVSPEHQKKFDEKLRKVLRKYETRFKVSYDISFSIQEPSTDTVAVDMDNEPFRTEDGQLLFRPAGHGALLENLAKPDADIIFIKNIDNIVPDRLKQETYLYKRLIGGYLIYLRDFVHGFLEKADNGVLTPEEVMEALEFAKTRLMLSLPELEKKDVATIKMELVTLFNRPIRVCGMVKNEGEPGGGPFWVRDHDGRTSLQIVESAQINMKDEVQKKISESATHFNPVDLVCCIKNYKAKKFELANFVDESTGLISKKSAGGKEIKAQELPGLWNGSMAGWLTVFVEVPIITFNPVKTINDLLRNEHQS